MEPREATDVAFGFVASDAMERAEDHSNQGVVIDDYMNP